MDALALLCTLHADGPKTWRKLRENGCDSLPGLARFEAEELSLILGGSTAGARRFLREARHLGERSGANLLEREEPAATVAIGVSAPAPVVVEEHELPVRDQEIVDDVLRAWREQDTRDFEARAAPTPELGEPQPEFERAPEPAFQAQVEAEHELESEVEAEPEVVVLPLPGQLALQPNLIEGLSESICERLQAEGVHTLEGLLEADLGQLALHSGLGYSRLYRWRSLAERHLRSLTAEVASPMALLPEHERLSPAEIPAQAPGRDLLQIPARGVELSRRTLRWSPLEEGAAGPFA